MNNKAGKIPQIANTKILSRLLQEQIVYENSVKQALSIDHLVINRDVCVATSQNNQNMHKNNYIREKRDIEM